MQRLDAEECAVRRGAIKDCLRRQRKSKSVLLTARLMVAAKVIAPPLFRTRIIGPQEPLLAEPRHSEEPLRYLAFCLDELPVRSR